MIRYARVRNKIAKNKTKHLLHLAKIMESWQLINLIKNPIDSFCVCLDSLQSFTDHFLGLWIEGVCINAHWPIVAWLMSLDSQSSKPCHPVVKLLSMALLFSIRHNMIGRGDSWTCFLVQTLHFQQVYKFDRQLHAIKGNNRIGRHRPERIITMRQWNIDNDTTLDANCMRENKCGQSSFPLINTITSGSQRALTTQITYYWRWFDVLWYNVLYGGIGRSQRPERSSSVMRQFMTCRHNKDAIGTCLRFIKMNRTLIFSENFRTRGKISRICDMWLSIFFRCGMKQSYTISLNSPNSTKTQFQWQKNLIISDRVTHISTSQMCKQNDKIGRRKKWKEMKRRAIYMLILAESQSNKL